MANRSTVLLSLLLAAALPACGRRNRDDTTSPDGPGNSTCGTIPHRITLLEAQGGRMDWSHSSGRIAYDRPGTDGFFDVWVMAADGSGDTCLTCDRAGLPPRHNGNPAWHPSGNYIVFQSEVATSRTPFASPGRGVNNVLWVTDPAGRAFYQITDITAANEANGVLHPHFSPDGTKLSWSEMYEGAGLLEAGSFYGHWRLVIADFVVGGDGRPAVRNLRRFERDPGFYENHGFSPDGSQLLFSSNFASAGVLGGLNNDIYLADVGSLALTRLTSGSYNEHAQFFPSGRKIVWMSNADNPGRGTDLWIMNPDGSGKERLTFMARAGCAEYVDDRAVTADNSVNAAGDKIAVYTHDDLFGEVGSIKLVELDRPF